MHPASCCRRGWGCLGRPSFLALMPLRIHGCLCPPVEMRDGIFVQCCLGAGKKRLAGRRKQLQLKLIPPRLRASLPRHHHQIHSFATRVFARGSLSDLLQGRFGSPRSSSRATQAKTGDPISSRTMLSSRNRNLVSTSPRLSTPLTSKPPTTENPPVQPMLRSNPAPTKGPNSHDPSPDRPAAGPSHLSTWIWIVRKVVDEAAGDFPPSPAPILLYTMRGSNIGAFPNEDNCSL